MSYKSPIEVIWEEQRASFENDVLRMVQSYDINVDKGELIKALAYDRGQYEKGYADGKAEAIKHGKWEIEEQMPFGVNVFAVRCSECGKEALVDGLEPMWRYCPKCGAKMDKVQP